MVTREQLQGKWMQLKGQIREKWGNITDDELQRVQGNAEQLVGFLTQKTGQARKDIEGFLDEAIEGGQNFLKQAADSARDYGQRISETARQGYEQAEQQLEAGYKETREMVRSHPTESIATAFGVGIVTGVLISLMLRSNRSWA